MTTTAIVLGLLVGLGCAGVLYALVPVAPSLEAMVRVEARKGPPGDQPVLPGRVGRVGRVQQSGITWARDAGVLDHPSWSSLSTTFALTGSSPDVVVARVLGWAGSGLVLPPALWALASLAGVALPLVVPVALAAVLVLVGTVVPFAQLFDDAKVRRRHVRIVVGSYVDLVVLCLAGGAGIESALLAAADVSTDWASRRLLRSLLLARDSGQPAWSVLGDLGRQWDVQELCELASTLQLAGTEGARVRQALSARAVSLRRHEQADAESAANATTERLFLPGALLLVGFLLFIGYPAFSRILGGF